MKKGKRKQILALLTAVAVCFSIFAVPMSDVQAASPKFKKKIEYTLYKRNVLSCKYCYIENPTKKGKITNLKCSNKKVIEVKKMSGNNHAIAITPKKAGKATISFKYAGKKYTSTVVIKKWENPCKTFKLGKKDYASYFEKSGTYQLHKQKKNQKVTVNIVAKKGWKLKKITNTGTKVKNKSKVSLEKWGIYGTGSNVEAEFYNTKTKETVRLSFGYSGFKQPSGNIYW